MAAEITIEHQTCGIRARTEGGPRSQCHTASKHNSLIIERICVCMIIVLF